MLKFTGPWPKGIWSERSVDGGCRLLNVQHGCCGQSAAVERVPVLISPICGAILCANIKFRLVPKATIKLMMLLVLVVFLFSQGTISSVVDCFVIHSMG